MSILLKNIGANSIDHLAELTDLLDRSCLESIGLQVICKSRFEKRCLMGSRSCIQGTKRSISDTSGRLVDHPLERLVIIRIDRKLEIRHHILHFRPLEERVP